LLLITVEQKKRLVLKSVALARLIKFWQKGVFFDFLKDGPGLKFIGQELGQTGFPDADGTFNDYVFALSHLMRRIYRMDLKLSRRYYKP
jgi:hypothetical protein